VEIAKHTFRSGRIQSIVRIVAMESDVFCRGAGSKAQPLSISNKVISAANTARPLVVRYLPGMVASKQGQIQCLI